ncbi:MAG: MFS transporter, partial [Bacilli bacterium]
MKWSEMHMNLKIRLIASTATTLLYFMIFPFLALYFVEVFGAAVTGVLLVGVQCCAIVCKFWAGAWCDRYGRRPFLLAGNVGKALGFFAMSVGVIWDVPVFIFVGYT